MCDTGENSENHNFNLWLFGSSLLRLANRYVCVLDPSLVLVFSNYQHSNHREDDGVGGVEQYIGEY